MPYVLKPNKIFVKDPEGEGFLPQNVIADETAQDIVDRIENYGDTEIARVQQAVADSQSAIDSIDAQRNTIIASIASIAGQGTDTTLTQSGVAADAKATGDAANDLKSAIDTYVVKDLAAGATWVDGYYVNYSTGAIAENQYAAYFVIQLTNETSISVTSYLSSTYGVVFKDANDGYISGYCHNTAGEYTDKLEVPENAKYLYVTCVKAYKSVAKVLTSIDMTVEDLADKVEDCNDRVASKVDLKRIGINIPIVIESGIIKTDLTVYSSSGSRHSTATVTGGKKYRVTCYSANSNYPGAFYVSGGSPVTLLGGTAVTYENNIISIPEGITTLYLNGSTAAVVPALFEVTSAEYLYTEPNLYVELFADTAKTLTVKSKSGDAEIAVSFAKSGANNLPDFTKIDSVADDSLELSTKMKGTSVLATTSDWFAPFMVQAVNNADGDKPSGYEAHFTGGKHEYTNTGSGGTATARCTSLKYFVNGNAVDTYQGYANDVMIKWTNLVQGNNTKKADGTGREILQENHELYFDGRTWTASVELVPLEDIVMLRWYGLQCPHNGSSTANISYVGAVNRAAYAGNVNSNSGNNSASEIRIRKANLEIDFGVNPTYDCGLRQFYSGDSGAFNVGTAKKAYLWIINNTEMSATNKYYLKGYYQFALIPQA